MDTFTLAATSFIICLSLILTGKKDKLHMSLAGLCAAVFIWQSAVFLREFFATAFWPIIENLALLAIAPLTLRLFRHLTRNKSFISQGVVIIFFLLSLVGILALLTRLAQWPHFPTLIISYVIAVLIFCYLSMWSHAKRLPPSTEKKRLGYLLIACPIALLLSSVDFLTFPGYSFPSISGLVMAALLYLMLLIVAYPQLNELHEFFARALVIFISTMVGTIIFYFVALFFSVNTPSFTSVMMASFLIVISITPLKMILKKAFSFFYPESKDVFTSLYEFDEKLENEKAFMLAEMAPVLAHEIRNPLGSIKGAAQYLKSEAVTDEQKNLLDVIIEEANRLNAVVHQFMDYARPYQYKFKAQSINVIIQKAISVIAANKLAENINIVRELNHDLPEVELDEQQFMQVILNIALNAIEAMPQGGTLTFRTFNIATSAEGGIGVTIRDTGSGIGREEIKNIFKPFYTTKKRGVGLGLAICQKIIKEHGGLIRVKSIPGQGTVFFIKLRAGSLF
ncbi:MAG TPA: ATP-binding protein [Smithellaceae bacterium]|nr:ATP-binding protein [Smithellaceae bacterium]HRS89094.1 ATP-binding protein [Smithellaceae bacterium]HRV26012.1 ATP-binding protein [Smithellaceae bacterium]